MSTKITKNPLEDALAQFEAMTGGKLQMNARNVVTKSDIEQMTKPVLSQKSTLKDKIQNLRPANDENQVNNNAENQPRSRKFK